MVFGPLVGSTCAEISNEVCVASDLFSLHAQLLDEDVLKHAPSLLIVPGSLCDVGSLRIHGLTLHLHVVEELSNGLELGGGLIWDQNAEGLFERHDHFDHLETHVQLRLQS